MLDALWARCEALLTDYHAKNPLHAGIRAAELRQRLFRAVEPERADALLALFVREGKLRFAAERYALADFTVRYTRRQTALRAELLALYRAADLRPERTDRVLACFDAKDRAEAERVLSSTIAVDGEAEAARARLIAILQKIGEYEPAKAEKESSFGKAMVKLSLWLYKYYGTSGYTQMPLKTVQNLFELLNDILNKIFSAVKI